MMKAWSCGLVAFVMALVVVTGVQATTYYVATNGTGNGTSWGLATNSIQGAINLCAPSDTVLVSNGVYETGGVTNWPAGTLLTNRVAITSAITVKSANNDPANTIIKGRFHSGEPGAGGTVTNGTAAVRCVYMAAGSSLIGFMLTNGATVATDFTDDSYGGGVYCPNTTPTISNCVIAGNSAASRGGGTIRGTLFNCTISGNSVVADYGGGAMYSVLSNCTIIGNSASGYGGGAYATIMYNCRVIGNSAPAGGGISFDGSGGILAMYNCTIVSNSAQHFTATQYQIS